jgi:hypothetical protein
MTKGPFNCLSSVYDLNNALLSFILTGYSGFLSAAGYVGPNFKVDHDITYLLPEIWSRMTADERNPQFLLGHGYLEHCKNFEYNGRTVPMERLGHRITRKFIRIFGGRMFNFPDAIFSDRMLHPETQDIDTFVCSMDTIVDAHRRAALLIMDNAAFEDAIPPLRALLSIAVHGQWEGMTLTDEKFRKMFTRGSVIGSDWYTTRLKKYQVAQIDHLTKGLERVRNFNASNKSKEGQLEANFAKRENAISMELEFARSGSYLQKLVGTIGQ